MEKDFTTLFNETVVEETENTDVTEAEEIVEEVETVETEETEIEETQEETEIEETQTEDEVIDTEETEDTVEVEEEDSKSNKKFAEMRVKLKELEDKNSSQGSDIDRFNEAAMKLGHKDYSELLSKTEEALLVEEAKSSGRTVEEIKMQIEQENRISELENKLTSKDLAEKQAVYDSTLSDFVSSNKLSDSDLKTIDEELARDGLKVQELQSLTTPALKRVLNSYLPKKISKQKELEKKVKIKNEIPLEQKSVAAEEVDDEVTKLYNQLKRKD